jgi:hypothetical protein
VYTSVIPALSLGQEDCEFQATIGYIARYCPRETGRWRWIMWRSDNQETCCMVVSINIYLHLIVNSREKILSWRGVSPASSCFSLPFSYSAIFVSLYFVTSTVFNNILPTYSYLISNSWYLRCLSLWAPLHFPLPFTFTHWAFTLTVIFCPWPWAVLCAGDGDSVRWWTLNLVIWSWPCTCVHWLPDTALPFPFCGSFCLSPLCGVSCGSSWVTDL